MADPVSRSEPADDVGGPPAAFRAAGESGPTRIRAHHGGTVSAVELAELPGVVAELGTRVWIDLTDPTLQHLADVSRTLGLHPLIAENIGERNQRAKIELVGDDIHIVLFAIRFEGEVVPIEIDFILSDRFLLTVHEGHWDPLAAPQLRSNPDAVLAKGPDYLLYALSDWIVDGYFPVMDRLADEIDTLQDDVVEKATRWTLERLFALKRELIGLRRAVSPAREIFNQLTNREIPLVAPDHVVYFRDVYDHLLRVTDELDNYRELVSGTLDAYLSTVNNNLSLIMKRLTGVTVLLAGIGAIAGIFGMSEAGAAFAGGEAGGFWLVALGTVAVAAGAAFVLRRIDWI